MSGSPDEVVAELSYSCGRFDADGTWYEADTRRAMALIADWRAKKAEIERLRSAMGTCRKYIVTHGPAHPTGLGTKKSVLRKIDAATGK